MNEVRAIAVKVGYNFELSSDAHGFSYGEFGIDVGEVFTQMNSGELFTKIPDDYSAPFKAKVTHKRYCKNRWYHRFIRKLIPSMFYNYDIVANIIEVDEK